MKKDIEFREYIDVFKSETIPIDLFTVFNLLALDNIDEETKIHIISGIDYIKDEYIEIYKNHLNDIYQGENQENIEKWVSELKRLKSKYKPVLIEEHNVSFMWVQ